MAFQWFRLDLPVVALMKTAIQSQERGAYLKLGAQITTLSLKSGCANFSINLIESQKVGAQMRTLAH